MRTFNIEIVERSSSDRFSAYDWIATVRGEKQDAHTVARGRSPTLCEAAEKAAASLFRSENGL